MGPKSNITGVLIRRGGIQKEDGHVIMEAEIGVSYRFQREHGPAET